MKRIVPPAALASALVLSGYVAAMAAGQAGHGHGHAQGHAPQGHAAGDAHAAFSAGEPGNPKRPARVIQVTMREGDGKMLFVPDRVEVKRGEQVKFVLRNSGALEHEFVLATTEENLKHADAMAKDSQMPHDDANAKRVAPAKVSEIVWKFTKPGQFEYGCLIPGHREAGMTGIVVVR